MKILFHNPTLNFSKATSGAGAGGLRVTRRLVLLPPACFIATRGTGSYTVNAATFAEGLNTVLTTGASYSFSSGNARIVQAQTTRDFNCDWEDVGDGVLLKDYAGAAPSSLAVNTTHVFSSLTSNYWHNSLVLNNKTSKTNATVVFNSTTRQAIALNMELQ